MGENYKTKTKVSMNSSEEIDFHNYINSVKQHKTPWDIFENVMKDVAYSNINRLKLLNAILLSELTTNYSDIDRLKYLNAILMTEFKEMVQTENDFQNTTEIENNIEYLQKSMNDRTIKEETEIQTLDPIEGDNLEDKDDNLEDNSDEILDDNSDDLMTKMGEIESNQSQKIFIEPIQTEVNFQNDEIKDFDDKSSIGSDLNNEILQEESEIQELELSTIRKLQLQIELDNLNDSPDAEKDTIESNQSKPEPKVFPCQFCNKEYSINFHLKQHIRNVHEEKTKYKCDYCDKTFSKECDLSVHNDKHIHTVHEGLKNYMCDTCEKSFTHKGYLKKHILTIHEGHRDYKCNFCGKFFTHAHVLKTHIRTVHNNK